MPKARFYLLPFLLFPLSLSLPQGLKMIQIFQMHPHLDNAKITSSSRVLQDNPYCVTFRGCQKNMLKRIS